MGPQITQISQTGWIHSICANLRNLWTIKVTRQVYPTLFNVHAL